MTDCDTPRGRIAIKYEQEIAKRMATLWSLDVTMTGIGSDIDTAPIDALFSRNGVLVAVAEIKTRNLDIRSLHHFNSYLITWDKLRHGRFIGRLLHVPYLLIVGLTDADVWWKISDCDGAWIEHPIIKSTVTQKNINGGLRRRRNAFVSLNRMRVAPFVKDESALLDQTHTDRYEAKV